MGAKRPLRLVIYTLLVWVSVSLFVSDKRQNEIILQNPRTFLFLFYNVHKEKMFTIEIEDGREAP